MSEELKLRLVDCPCCEGLGVAGIKHIGYEHRCPLCNGDGKVKEVVLPDSRVSEINKDNTRLAVQVKELREALIRLCKVSRDDDVGQIEFGFEIEKAESVLKSTAPESEATDEPS